MSRDEWKARYAMEFVRFAVSRGWSREDAETWPVNIADDAFMLGDACPIRAAQNDVPYCEDEAASLP